MKTFVIGDIHGAHRALMQCLELAQFDRQTDQLIVLGDVCDGFPEVALCFDELLKIPNLVYVIGNHDLWTLDWAQQGLKPEIWLSQGGSATLASYGDKGMAQSHVQCLKSARPWFEQDKKLYVHAGFRHTKALTGQPLDVLAWDRKFVQSAATKHNKNPKYRFAKYNDIFLGHTVTEKYGETRPLNFCNVWMMDTGAGWGGPLTIMDVKTKEFWQSEKTEKLYPEFKPRS